MIKRIIFCLIILSSLISLSFAKDSEEAVARLYEAWNKSGEERISILKEIIAKYPDSSSAQRAQIDIADEYNRSDDPDKAMQEYRKYVEKYPQTEKAQSTQSWIADYLFNKEKYKEALTEYRRFLELFPNSPTKAFAECRIADIEYSKLKIISPQEAVKKYLQIYEQAESKYHCSDAYWIAASILENDLNNYQDAVFCYKKFLNEYLKTDKAPEVLWRIAECFRKSGDSAQELSEYENLAKSYPGTRFAGDAMLRLAFYGERSEEEKKYEEALKAYSKFVELYSAQGWYVKGKGGGVGYGYEREIMRRIANIYRLRGDFEKAISMYQQLLQHDEEFLRGDFTHFDKRVEYQINHAQVYHQLEFIYNEMKLNNEAAKARKRGEEIEKDMADIKEVVTARFVDTENASKVSVLFSSIDIKNNQAIAEIGLSSGPDLGSGYKIWLERDKQGWIIKKFERTWVA